MDSIKTVDQLLADIEQSLTQHIQQKNLNNPLMVGIHTGGVWIAEKLHQSLTDNNIMSDRLGTLDISFYRDDFTRIGLNPKVATSDLPVAIEDRHVLLVDDVVMSGRTVRAALNALFEYGRPASVTLIALLDMDERELPIRADIIGQQIKLAKHERIKLTGPEPLQLDVIKAE